MNIKAVFFDIDGTFYDHTTNRVLPSTKEAVRKLKEQGIRSPYAVEDPCSWQLNYRYSMNSAGMDSSVGAVLVCMMKTES